MLEIANCIAELAGKIQAQEKLKTAPEVVGFRVIDGPWDNTKFLDVETKEKVYSALLLKSGSTISMVAPFKAKDKETIKK